MTKLCIKLCSYIDLAPVNGNVSNMKGLLSFSQAVDGCSVTDVY